MAKGKVDFFNDTGGYGFIESDDADEDVFFHMEDVGGPDLEEGQEVEFDIEEAEKGPRDERHSPVTPATTFRLYRFSTVLRLRATALSGVAADCSPTDRDLLVAD